MTARIAIGLVALLSCVAAGAHAVEIATTTAAALEPSNATIVARRVDRPAEPIESVVEVPGRCVLSLPDGLWELRLRSNALWAAPVYVHQADSVSIPVWPAVSLKVIARIGSALTVTFLPLDSRGVNGEVACNVDNGAQWACAIPPGNYDLRFSSKGYAPEYRFGVAVPTAKDVQLQFVAGASLSGRLDASRVRMRLEEVEVTLTADGVAKPALRYATKPSSKGFFQFKGLTPGAYTLRVRGQGVIASPHSVTIVERAAAEMNAPVVLDHPKSLTVTILPVLDPDLRRWRVELWRYDAERTVHPVSGSPASPDGQWSIKGLIAGDYLVIVGRDKGQWKSTTVTIDTSDVTLPLSVFAERINGTVTLGERPLAATLFFGGEGGFSLESDDDGRFDGEIPPGEGAERTVLVDAEAAGVRRTIQARLEETESGVRRLDVKLPATYLAGRVGLPDGSPKADVIVTVSGTGGLHQTFSGEDGTFQLTGIEPGEYAVHAEAQDVGRSDPVPVHLKDGDTAEIELILRSNVIVRGRIGLADIPMIEGDVYAIPRDASFAPFMPQTKTTAGGRFELTLPPRTTIADMIVVHPAFDITVARISVEPDTVRNIVATQVGGTLVVDSKTPAALVIRHNGGECWLSWLATLPGAGGSVTPTRVVVPRLEPGEYAVCSVKTKQCGRGYLAPYGTLDIALE